MKNTYRLLSAWLLLLVGLTACTDQLPTAPALDGPEVGAPAAFLGVGGAPIGDHVDSFEGSELNAARWIVDSAPGRAVVDNRLQVSVAPRTAEAVKVLYSLSQDFRGSTFHAEISQYASGASTLGTFLAVTDSAELSYVIFNAFGGQLTAWRRWSGAAPVQLSGSLPLDPVNHRFLRFREDAGTVYYETSSDGSTWTTRWTVAHAFPDPANLRGMLGVQAWGSTSSNPVGAIFEGINTLAPAAPRDLAATYGGPLAIDLSWQDRSVNESGFEVERRLAGETSFSSVASLPANTTSYRDTAVVGDVTYEYRIRAVGSSGASDISHVTSATALAAPPPLPPSLSTLVDTFDGSAIDLDLWEVIGHESSIGFDNRLELVTRPSVNEHVYARNREALSFEGATFNTEISQFSTGTSTTETFIGVYSEDEEEYVAISIHNNRLSAWYKWREMSNFVQLSGTVTLNPTQHRFYQFREQGGTVYYETSADGQNWVTRWTVQHQFDDIHHLHAYLGVGTWGTPNPNPTVTYFENVNSIVPASPRELTATGGPEYVQIAWQDRSVNESGFQVERRQAGDPSFTPIVSTAANVSSYLDSGLTEGVTYEYRVRAFGPTGTSAFTGIASATAEVDTTPPPPPPPPTFAALVDDFAGTSLNTAIWDARVNPGRMTVNDGLELGLAANTIENNSLLSTETYDFTGSAYQVEISRYASGSSTMGTYVAVTNANETSYVIFNIFNNQLTAWRRWNGGTPVQIGSTTLNATNHRFLRLREAAGRVYFETSANGVSWTTRWNVAHSFSTLQLHGIVGVQSWGTTHSNPVSAIIESVGVVTP